MEKDNESAAVSENSAAEAGKTLPKAQASGVNWIGVDFTRAMRIAWNWEDLLQRFTKAYRYFRGMTFEEDTDLLGLGFRRRKNLGYEALKNHLCHTYMSFVLSELSDEEMEKHLAP